MIYPISVVWMEGPLGAIADFAKTDQVVSMRSAI